MSKCFKVDAVRLKNVLEVFKRNAEHHAKAVEGGKAESIVNAYYHRAEGMLFTLSALGLIPPTEHVKLEEQLFKPYR